jgi:hypothetical protein
MEKNFQTLLTRKCMGLLNKKTPGIFKFPEVLGRLARDWFAAAGTIFLGPQHYKPAGCARARLDAAEWGTAGNATRCTYGVGCSTVQTLQALQALRNLGA